MLAPTVEVIWAGLKAPLQKRVTRDVLPTPWEPRTTIFASREDDIVVVGGVSVVVFLLFSLFPARRLAVGDMGFRRLVRSCVHVRRLVRM